MSLLGELNNTFLRLHAAKEDATWASKMNHDDAAPGATERADLELKQFTSDPSRPAEVERELARDDLRDEERTALDGWRHFFRVNAIPDEGARDTMKEIVELEGRYARGRARHRTGYVDPADGSTVPASSVKLRLLLQTSPDEAVRKAAFQGLRDLEGHALDNGFLEMVRLRNRFARRLGFPDFYAWKVQASEGFSQDKLFVLLEELEQRTRSACHAALDRVAADEGQEALAPWNFEYATAGDLAARKDPWLRFEDALLNWGRSYGALGIRYRGATLQLDLVERPGKYENGFMHGPGLCWMEGDTWHPARINFTANAVPGQTGSGSRALNTLFHEGGHAAQFSNILMPAPCFSTEYPPTSIAFAETQAMLLDSLVEDPEWLARYARNGDGEPLPEELILGTVEEKHLLRPYLLRKLMVVPFFERELYRLGDEELTAERVLALGREVEERLVLMEADSRPVLAVPHLLDNESSAYYHAYVLALMAVDQTRAFFRQRDGALVDNPAVGRDLAEHYWAPGNSRPFLSYVQALTGRPFSADDAAARVDRPLEEALAEARADIERGRATPASEEPVRLEGAIRMVHGDEVVAEMEQDGSFEEMAAAYGAWIRAQEEQA